MIAEYCLAKKFLSAVEEVEWVRPAYPARLEALCQAAMRLID
ncbi:Unknown protein sequence [Pseudomonas syringae pv. maculicola]|nr:Unknown protein sequence [Pseudomonas syringae pv. maculicola]